MNALLRKHKYAAGAAAALLVVAAGIGPASLGNRRPHHAQAGAAKAAEADKARPEDAETEATDVVTVKTVRPKRGPSLEVTIEQPANVEAYYRADLHARVAGPVTFLEKDKGAVVTKGERLIEIDVPDLRQEVAQKQAVIAQRRCDREVAEAAVRIARAGVAAAEKAVQEAESRAVAAEEEKEFRAKEYTRFKALAGGKSPAVTPDVVDERLKWSNVARANKDAADAAVLRAKADLETARQKVEGALADVDLKKALIKVAEEDRARARAMLDLATIRAPFDGDITSRTISPGDFAHNAASSAQTRPLLTVERTDIVTVTMNVPDKYAPYVDLDSEAFIELNELPGEQIRARVSRFVRSLQTPEHDRTMRVEVDLFNGSPAEYARFCAREKELDYSDLKWAADPRQTAFGAGTAALLAAPLGYGPVLAGAASYPGRARLSKEARLPKLPSIAVGEDTPPSRRLMPGMYGKMKLVLRKFRDVYLLPSHAVCTRGGTPYIYQVEAGVAHRLPVVVEMDDGHTAHVRIRGKKGDRFIRRELTGDEEIVVSNQAELADGHAVETTEGPW